jgi:hypothetical protein
MEEKKTVSLTNNKTIFRIAGLVVVLAALYFLWCGFFSALSKEYIRFQSGAFCFVFIEPKLVIIVGDGGEEEVFDHFESCGLDNSIAGDPFYCGFGSSTTNGVVNHSYKRSFGRTTIEFLNGKYVMNFSLRGTKLTLADGRTFTLDGKTPLWLRCKSDGTIVELDELPEGLIEFFEVPSEFARAGYNKSLVKSYPAAFRK